jgi:hypothetical protein
MATVPGVRAEECAVLMRRFFAGRRFPPTGRDGVP